MPAIQENPMRKFAAFALAGAFAFSLTAPVLAADPPKAANPQQERMKDCNAKATGKTGDARKEFMSACLSGKDAPKMTQQEKMTYCNKQATGKSGDDRKKFMSSCLSA